MSDESPRRRRRIGLGTTVGAAVVLYGGYSLATWAWNKWVEPGEEDDDEAQHHATFSSSPGTHTPSRTTTPLQRRFYQRLRNERLAQCRHETRQAMVGFSGTLRKIIELSTDSSVDKKALKNLRSKARDASIASDRNLETELWGKIQTATMSRMIVTAYAYSLLHVIVLVQVNMLGGQMYQKAIDDSPHSSESGTVHVREESNTHYRTALTKVCNMFLHHGLPILIGKVREAVRDALDTSDWDIFDPSSALSMTRGKFQMTVETVRTVIELQQCKDRSILHMTLAPLVHWRDASSEKCNPDDHKEHSHAFLDETFDLLESPVIDDAISDSLNAVFERMEEEWKMIFHADDGTDVERPLTKVVAQLKHTTNGFYESSADASYSQSIESLPTVLEAADISFD